MPMTRSTRLVILLGFFFSSSVFAASAYEIFEKVLNQSVTLERKVIKVNGEAITFGGEKEGSSTKITRVMSPNKQIFAEFLNANPAFALEFFENWSSGRWRAREVVDMNGRSVSAPNPEDFRAVTEENLRETVERWLSQINRSPFSFISQVARNKIYRVGKDGQPGRALSMDFDSRWETTFGAAERHIESGHKEISEKAWELILKPVKSYGEFEAQIKWLRETLADKDSQGRIVKLFEAPGHQRIRIPKYQIDGEKRERMSELARSLQNYILLKELAGNTGILISKYKDLLSESEIRNWDSNRGVIRLEQDRFGGRSWLVEFRTGTKTKRTRQFVQAVFAARMASRNFSGLEKFESYSLEVQTRAESFKLSNGTQLFTQAELRKAIQAIKRVSVRRGDRNRNIKFDMVVPLWNWADSPVGKNRADTIKKHTADFVRRINEKNNLSYEDLTREIQRWTRASYLIESMERYMKPKQKVKRGNPTEVTVRRGGINVNKIDLGLEFTARPPLKSVVERRGDRWVRNIYAMSAEEMAEFIERMTKKLAQNLKTEGTVTRVQAGGHGHELGVEFEFEDRRGRTWKVEWDGIARAYNRNGEVIPKSVRGGHIEIVTPKMSIGEKEIRAIYKTYEQMGIQPSRTAGGTHVNIDMERFFKKPEKLARFLTLYHGYRGIISFMFQSVERIRNAEPANLSQRDFMKIKNFRGTGNAQADATALARLLYDARYFNDRQGRKSRYTHWNLLNFIGRVIPAHLIAEDFNIVRVNQGFENWRRQFQVGPLEKMEGRFFDAPLTVAESAQHIRLVRALLNKTFNSTANLAPELQMTTHEQYARDPAKAYKDLAKMCEALGLEVKEFKGLLTERIVQTQNAMARPGYETYEQRAQREYPRQSGWGRSLRTPHSRPVYSQDRVSQIEDTNGRMCGRAVPGG